MSDTKEIVWEAPPARGWRNALASVATRRGEWARIATKSNPGSAGALASQLRKLAREMGGEWEIVARTNGAGSHVYARFVGADRDGK